MKKVPKMISTKDLAYINDIFNWNITMVNKLNFYLATVKDKDLISEFTQLRNMHQKICDDLILILEGKNK